MAWADISAYTVADLKKAKAEITEVMASLAKFFVDNRTRNGLITDEEHYASLYTDKTLRKREGEISVKIANEVVAAATFSVDGDDVFVVDKNSTEIPAETKANIKAELLKAIEVLAIEGCSVSVIEVLYTAPTTSANGSYKFKALLEKAGETSTTVDITATVVKLTA